MARRILKISNINQIDENTTSIGGGLIDQKLDNNILTNIVGNPIHVIDDNNNKLKIQVINLQVNLSLAGFKNIFILISNKDAKKIKTGYEVVID